MAAGKRVADLSLPDGALVISVLRDGSGFVPEVRHASWRRATRCSSCSIPGLEDDITKLFVSRRREWLIARSAR